MTTQTRHRGRVQQRRGIFVTDKGRAYLVAHGLLQPTPWTLSLAPLSDWPPPLVSGERVTGWIGCAWHRGREYLIVTAMPKEERGRE